MSTTQALRRGGRRRRNADPDADLTEDANVTEAENEAAEFDEQVDNGGFSVPLVEDDEADFLNDPRMTDLPSPPVLGGTRRSTDVLGFGEDADQPVGRASSPKLFAQQAAFPNVTQLRVFKLENGNAAGLGAIDAEASEEELVRRFIHAMPRPGEEKATFILRPIDALGREIGKETSITIHESHQTIQRMRGAAGGQAGGPGSPFVVMQSPAGMAPELMTFLQQQMRMQDERMKQLEAQLQEERCRQRELDEQRASERVDLANNAAQGVHSIHERARADEAARAQMLLQQQQAMAQAAIKQQADGSSTLLQTLTTIFAQQQASTQSIEEARRRQDEYRLEQERARAERERKEAEDRRALERQEAEHRLRMAQMEADSRLKREHDEIQAKLERERNELDRKMQAAKEDAERRERMQREEMEERRRKDAEERERRERYDREMNDAREKERERQHQRMMAEQAASAEKERQHAERMMQLSQRELDVKSGGNVTDMIAKGAGMLKNLGLDPQEALRNVFGGGEQSGGGAEALAAIAGALGPVLGDVIKGVLSARAQSQLPMLPMMPGIPQIPQQQVAPQTVVTQVNPQTGQTEVVAAEGVPAEEAAKVPVPPESETMQAATAAGLGIPAQRNARKALRELISRLKNSGKDAWVGHITASLSAELAIYHYVTAVSVRKALIEAGSDAEFAETVITAMRESGLVPPDLNYG